MNGEEDRERRPVDEDLLHELLDGALSPEDASALERRIEADPAMANRLRMLRGMEAWVRDTRSPAPPDLGAGVLRALAAERERSPEDPAGRTARGVWPRSPRRTWLRAPRWAWTLIPAAAVVLLVLLFRGGGPRQSDRSAGAPGAPVGGPAAASEMVAHLFEFSGNARQVCLVGSFNLWKVCATPLHPSGDGSWSVTLELPPGRYEYMYVVDGQWETDPNSPQRIDDGFGRQNAVLVL